MTLTKATELQVAEAGLSLGHMNPGQVPELG